MRNAIVILSLLVLGTTALVAGSAVATTASEKGSFELTVKTSLDPAHPGIVTCTAVMKNTKTGEVLAAPQTTFKAGEGAELTSKTDRSTFTLKIGSDVEKNRGTANAQYAVDGEVVFAPSLSFDLR